MEPVTTTILTAFVIDLAKKGIEEIVKSSGANLSDGAFKWLKNLFYKEDKKPKKTLENLILNPENKDIKNSMVAIIKNEVEDNPLKQKYLDEIIENYKFNYFNEIKESKNINTGNINTDGGDFRIGDDYGK